MTNAATPIRTERRYNPFAVEALRIARGYETAADFATKADVQPAYYSKITSGSRQPSAEVVARIANTLRVDVRAITSEVAMYAVGELVA